MLIELKVSQSGDRYSHAAGEIVDVEEAEAGRMIEAGQAVAAPPGAKETAFRGPAFAEIPAGQPVPKDWVPEWKRKKHGPPSSGSGVSAIDAVGGGSVSGSAEHSRETDSGSNGKASGKVNGKGGKKAG